MKSQQKTGTKEDTEQSTFSHGVNHYKVEQKRQVCGTEYGESGRCGHDDQQDSRQISRTTRCVEEAEHDG